MSKDNSARLIFMLLTSVFFSMVSFVTHAFVTPICIIVFRYFIANLTVGLTEQIKTSFCIFGNIVHSILFQPSNNSPWFSLTSQHFSGKLWIPL